MFDSKYWHEPCFTCSVCNGKITVSAAVSVNGLVSHKSCLLKQRTTSWERGVNIPANSGVGPVKNVHTTTTSTRPAVSPTVQPAVAASTTSPAPAASTCTCGSPLNPNAKFCEHCGKKTQALKNSLPSPPAPVVTSNATASGMTCVPCSSLIEQGLKFCTVCGAKGTVTAPSVHVTSAPLCVACSSPLQANLKWCTSCGSAASAAASTAVSQATATRTASRPPLARQATMELINATLLNTYKIATRTRKFFNKFKIRSKVRVFCNYLRNLYLVLLFLRL